MKKKHLILFVACACSAVSAWAQTENENAAVKASAAGNWYIEAGVGTQLFFGEDAGLLDFGKRLTPAFSLTGGRWFNPFWGVRLQANAYSLNGFSTSQGLYVGDPTGDASIFGPNDPVRDEVAVRPDGSYRYYLRYMNLHTDIHVSLASLIMGYDPQRKWDIIPAAGIGYMQTFAYKGTPAISALSTHFSIMGKWKLPKGFDVNMEVFTTVLPDRFDGRIVSRNYEPVLGLTVGATYNFGQRATVGQKAKAQSKAEAEADLMNQIRRAVREEISNQIESLHTTDTVTVTVVKEVEKVPATEQPLRIASIRFENGKATPLRYQEVQLANIAEFAKANPAARFIIEGYADNETGSKNFNLQLSEKRAAAIKDLLVKDYELPADRLELKAYGSDVQVYEQSTWNRVVIVKAVK